MFSQFHPNLNLSDYIGVHEMVQIVAESTFGRGGTLMMTEGLAVAIDGTLGPTDSTGKTWKLVAKGENQPVIHITERPVCSWF